MNYILAKREKLEFFTIPQLNENDFLIYGFTTKNWTKKSLIENFNLEKFSILSLRQIHSDKFHIIEKTPNKILRGDALITSRPYILFTIRTADCLPILLFDPKKRVIGAIHSGWRGTVKQITKKVVKKMITSLGISSSSLFAFLGPCICQKCYQVGREVKEMLEMNLPKYNSFLVSTRESEKHFLDLRKANIIQLNQAVLKDTNIINIELCTKCNPRLFHSYRREPHTKGRMLAFVGIRG
ncbi:MAG: peptidoglycan editing factor PgeF [Candidatus Aminicenantia bacterium]